MTSESDVPKSDTDQPEPIAEAPAEPAQRSFTVRSLAVGAALAAIMAVVVPWNDWGLKNTGLVNNYMPPVIILSLLLLGLVVNPLLGAWRLARGELVVVTVMLLGVAGIASSGLMRFWPTTVAYPQRLLGKEVTAFEELQIPLTEAERAVEIERLQGELTGRFSLLDEDGDGQIALDADADLRRAVAAAEQSVGSDTPVPHPDRDQNGSVSLAEYAEALAPTWRWPLSGDLFMGIPSAGPVDTGDPEIRHNANRYLDGVTKTDEPMIGYRSRVSWRDSSGALHERELALRGPMAQRYRDEGRTFIDLDGASLNGLTAGDVAALPSDVTHVIAEGDTWESLAQQYYQEPARRDILIATFGSEQLPPVGQSLAIPELMTVIEVVEPPIPWSVWFGHLLAWAPLIGGSLLAMVAIAGLVRRQWIHHERLPYPIAEVTMTLLENPEPGRRFAPIFCNNGFRIAALITFLVIVWKGLYLYEWVPADVTTRLDLYNDNGPFSGSPWNHAYKASFLFIPKLYFSLVALVFFLPLDLGFSLWFFFLLTGAVTIFTGSSGIPLEDPHLYNATVGGYAMMALLILWMGRSYYGKVLKAAVVGHRDPGVRAAVPYVWGLLAGAGLILAFMLAQGASLGASVLVVVMFLGALLVISRMVAEAGIPFLQTPNGPWLNTVLLSVIGVSLPVSALVPLTYIGMTLMADSKESLMPYAVNAGYLGDKARAPARRLSLTLLLAAVLGCGIAMTSMVSAGYDNGATQKDAWPSMVVRDNALRPIATQVAEQDRGVDATGRTGAERLSEQRHEIWWSYAAGGVITALLGFARMVFSAWPLHPLGYLTSTSYPVWLGWFSFMVGWSIKAITMRYGGTGVYQKMKPVMIGIIAGEALGLGLFFLIKVIGAVFFGIEDIKVPQVLPG